MHVLAHWRPFLSQPQLFPHALGCGARRGAGRVYTRHKFGPRMGSWARALGVQNCASWQVIAGSLSADPEPTRPMESPQISILSLFCALLLFLEYHAAAVKSRLDSHDTAASLQAFPFVTATNGASASVCVRERA